jgi:hypothetical protein
MSQGRKIFVKLWPGLGFKVLQKFVKERFVKESTVIWAVI